MRWCVYSCGVCVVVFVSVVCVGVVCVCWFVCWCVFV